MCGETLGAEDVTPPMDVKSAFSGIEVHKLGDAVIDEIGATCLWFEFAGINPFDCQLVSSSYALPSGSFLSSLISFENLRVTLR